LRSSGSSASFVVIDFRKCEICGRPLEGPEGELREVEHRRLDPAEDAVLQRDVPEDLPEGSVCDACLRDYRRRIGGGEGPGRRPGA
jgi:hypothetical protein